MPCLSLWHRKIYEILEFSLGSSQSTPPTSAALSFQMSTGKLQFLGQHKRSSHCQTASSSHRSLPPSWIALHTHWLQLKFALFIMFLFAFFPLSYSQQSSESFCFPAWYLPSITYGRKEGNKWLKWKTKHKCSAGKGDVSVKTAQPSYLWQ